MKLDIPLEQEIEHCVQKCVTEVLKEELPKLIREVTQKDWLTREEVKELTGYSDRTLQYLRDSRQIPFSQHGRKILYPRKGISAFLEENTVKPKSQQGGMS